eukprot:scaffold1312_cov264-Pinguiococcus_pyrenoidosus.AAC.1
MQTRVKQLAHSPHRPRRVSRSLPGSVYLGKRTRVPHCWHLYPSTRDAPYRLSSDVAATIPAKDVLENADGRFASKRLTVVICLSTGFYLCNRHARTRLRLQGGAFIRSCALHAALQPPSEVTRPLCRRFELKSFGPSAKLPPHARMKSRVRFYGTRLEALEDVHTSTPVFEAQLRSLAPKREVASGRWPTDLHRGRVRAKLRTGGTDQAKGLPLLRVCCLQL